MEAVYGFCKLSIIPCRREASDKSEMLNQLLFGETYEVLEIQKKWIKIRSFFDQYESWICIKQYTPITKPLFDELNANTPQFQYEMIQVVEHQSQIFPIVLGSHLYGINNDILKVGEEEFRYEGALCGAVKTKSTIVQDAFMYLQAPYLWGGKSPFGIDCSGLTQMVYKLNGIFLPRDAWQQAQCGEVYSFVEESEAGDLAFFDNEEGKIVHVGIVLDNGRIIHASGTVRIDKLDHYGIFNEELNKYTHKLRLIKNMF